MQIQEIAQLINGDVAGDAGLSVSSLCSPEAPVSGGITIVNKQEALSSAINSDVAVIVLEKTLAEPKTDKTLIYINSFQDTFIQLLKMFAPKTVISPGSHPTASIADDANIAQEVEISHNVVIGAKTHISNNTKLMANVVVGQSVQIGHNVVIHPNVTIYDNCIIGNSVIIHANSVVGADGFGYQFDGKSHVKRYHLGNVIIEDDVEIGANTTIDRATLGSTVVGKGTKIDNHVQVAHNVKLGENNILCGFTGIAGSSTTGKNVIMAADVGVSDHVTIEDNVILGARTGIPPKKRLTEGTTWLGNPGRPEKKAIEQILSVQRLPGLKKQLVSLTDRLKAIENKAKELLGET